MKNSNAVNSSKSTKSNRKKLPVLWRRVIGLLCCALVIGIIVSFVTFFKNRSEDRVSVTLQMSFDGAADGIAPNGYRFDVAELLSDEVVTGALKATSLDGKCTVDEIRKCITVSGRYPSDIVSQTMSYDSLLDFTANRQLTIDKFHPTQFTITLENPADNRLSKAQMQSLLENIIAEYKKYFAEVAVMGRPGDAEPFDLADYDYAQQLEIIERRIRIMGSYASEMYEKEPSFRSSDGGFNDIVVRLHNLINNDISRISAKLTLNALTKDPERLLSQYRYELKNLNNQLAAQNKVLALVDKMVGAYEKADILYISTQDALTKIDGNSSETYDKLVEIRKDIADSNTKLNSRKEDIVLKLQDLLGGVDSKVVVNSDSEFVNREESADPNANTSDNEPGENDTTDIDGSGSGDTDANSGDNNGAGENGNNSGSGDGKIDDNGSGNGTADIDITSWTDEQIVAALQKAAENSAGQRESLEKEISMLVARCDEVMRDFSKMLQDWNAEKVNDLTMEVGRYAYSRQGVVSSAFIRNGIKRMGPFMAVAMIISLIMIIVSNVKDEKKHSDVKNNDALTKAVGNED
ncbi:MAG: hypothetical protein J5649_00205 [Lachnospiraceae bacterium]|nr:hypothetical protein [Lachnospiraceae bacterium]